MTIRWITPELGTAPFESRFTQDFYVIDVRDLVDKGGNDSIVVLHKIEQGVDALRQGRRVIVCCDYGISRSNAIAVGILARYLNQDFNAALRQVQTATGELQIKLELLMVVRQALGFDEMRSVKLGDRRKVLVTGGSGFVGRAFLAAAEDTFEVLAPSHQELDLTTGSMQLDALLDRFEADSIVHLANPRVYTSNMALGQTLTMLRNVMDVCLNRRILLVYMSGWEIYSGYAGTLIAHEALPALPRGPYGETKYLAETMIQHACQNAGLRCALLRSGPVYGEGSDRPKFLYNFMEKARQSEEIVTHDYNNGRPALDLMHVEDLSDALVRLVESGLTGSWNVGTGTLTTTDEIARLLVRKLASNSLIRTVRVHADVACIAMNFRQAEHDFGWRPRISLEQGLEHILTTVIQA